MSDPQEDYDASANAMAMLVAQMIAYLDKAPERTIGGRWRTLAEAELRRFKTARMARRQRGLFNPEGS